MKNDTHVLDAEYTKLISSLVDTAITHTEGIATETAFSEKRLSPKKHSHIVRTENEVTVDVFVNVIFGYNIPNVACQLQEKIIQEIQKNTPLRVKNVNVHVVNAIFI